MRWGHDFPKDKGVGMLTLNLFRKNPCVMWRTHQNYQLPFFLSFLPNNLLCQKVVEVVIAWKGKSMGKFELGRAPSFGMSCFACMDNKKPEPYASLTHMFTFWFYSHILRAVGRSGSIIIHSLPVVMWKQESSKAPPRSAKCGFHIHCVIFYVAALS